MFNWQRLVQTMCHHPAEICFASRSYQKRGTLYIQMWSVTLTEELRFGSKWKELVGNSDRRSLYKERRTRRTDAELNWDFYKEICQSWTRVRTYDGKEKEANEWLNTVTVHPNICGRLSAADSAVSQSCKTLWPRVASSSLLLQQCCSIITAVAENITSQKR